MPTEEPLVSVPEPPPVAVMAGTCCANSDPSSAGACALCKRPICRNCLATVNLKQVCADCRAQILSELEAEKATVVRLPPAIAMGVLAALVCGAVWALIAVLANIQIGFAAVGVGFVTGWGVLLGSGQKRSRELQWIAVACSVLGLVFGKYFIVAHAIVTNVKGAEDVSLFDPRLASVFFQHFGSFLSPFDFLWVFLAFRVAWRVPKPRDVRVS